MIFPSTDRRPPRMARMSRRCSPGGNVIAPAMRTRKGMERSRRTPRGEYFEMMSARAKACSFHDSVLVAGTLLQEGSTPAAFLEVSESLLVQLAAETSASLTP